MSRPSRRNEMLERRAGSLSADRLYRALFESIDEGVMIVGDDGLFVDVNDAVARILRLSREELIGRPFTDFVPPDRLADARCSFEELKTTGRFGGVFPLRRSDGTEVTLEWRSKADFVPGLHVCIARELTDRRRSEVHLGLAMKAARMILWEWDAVRKVLRSTPSVREFWGDVNISTFDDSYTLIHPEDRERHRATVREAVNRGGSYRSCFRVILPTNGQIRWMDEHGAVVLDADGRLLSMTGTAVDITTRKEAEDRLIQQAQELWRSNKELEQFAYVSSHDLKEPLRKISSYAELLERRADNLSPEARRCLDNILSSSHRMNALIDDLLTYSRLGHENGREDVDLNAVASQVMADLEPQVRESAADVQIGPLPVVRAGRSHMQQLLQNLLSNAIKFRGSAAPKVEVVAYRRRHSHVISVKDNGIGIDPSYHEKIFHVFQRLHGRDKYPGTGIGLAICNKIVEKYGGRMELTSAEGRGSEFRIVLPASPSSQP